MNSIPFSTSTCKLPQVLPLSPVRTLMINPTCGFSTSVSKFTGLCGSPNLVRIEQQRRRIRIRCGAVQEINEGQFSDLVLKSDRPVLVEFVATWCGPCRLIAPAIESLAQEYEGQLAVVKIDHDANPKLIEEYKVYGLPTLILFKDGKEVPDSRREGAITKVKLKEYVDALLKTVSVA